MSIFCGALTAVVLFTLLWIVQDKLGHPFYVGLIGVGIIGIVFLVIFKVEDYREWKQQHSK